MDDFDLERFFQAVKREAAGLGQEPNYQALFTRIKKRGERRRALQVGARTAGLIVVLAAFSVAGVAMRSRGQAERNLLSATNLPSVIASESEAGDCPATPSPLRQADHRSSSTPGEVAVELTSSSPSLAAGEVVAFVLEVTNRGPSITYWSGRQLLVTSFTTEDGSPVITSVEEQVFPADLVKNSLSADEIKRAEFSWNGLVYDCGTDSTPERAPSGRYYVKAAWAVRTEQGDPAFWWSDPVAVDLP